MTKMIMRSSEIVKHFYVIKQISLVSLQVACTSRLHVQSWASRKNFLPAYYPFNILVCPYSESDYVFSGNIDNHRLHIGFLDHYEQLLVLLQVDAILLSAMF
jgi:hypothetical protein